MKVTFEKSLYSSLSSLVANYKYITGIRKTKDKRKKVKRGQIVNTSRGIASAKSRQRSPVDNAKVMSYLYAKNFRFYSESFTKNNPNYSNFLKSTKYLISDDTRRFENAITANVKAYLDKQTQRKNKASTARSKKFNKFGIDSRQMQLALDSERTDKKTKSDIKLDDNLK